jgi:hypothetical protein
MVNASEVVGGTSELTGLGGWSLVRAVQLRHGLLRTIGPAMSRCFDVLDIGLGGEAATPSVTAFEGFSVRIAMPTDMEVSREGNTCFLSLRGKQSRGEPR